MNDSAQNEQINWRNVGNACVLSIARIMNAQMTFMLNQKWHMNEGKCDENMKSNGMMHVK